MSITGNDFRQHRKISKQNSENVIFSKNKSIIKTKKQRRQK